MLRCGPSTVIQTLEKMTVHVETLTHVVTPVFKSSLYDRPQFLRLLIIRPFEIVPSGFMTLHRGVFSNLISALKFIS